VSFPKPIAVSVRGVCIVDQFRTVVAILTPNGWIDPWGGTFDARDVLELDSIARQPDGMTHRLRGRELPRAKVYVEV
jgi:hypothetical protein